LSNFGAICELSGRWVISLAKVTGAVYVGEQDVLTHVLMWPNVISMALLWVEILQ